MPAPMDLDLPSSSKPPLFSDVTFAVVRRGVLDDAAASKVGTALYMDLR